jgi:hypothetical protein
VKRLLVLLGCAFFLSVPGGCQSAEEAVVGPKGQFPDFLVGAWQSQGGKWGLTFDSDGSISTIRHPFVTVEIDMAEGGAYEEGREGAHSIYAMGHCTASYDPNKRELNVEINFDYFKVVLPVGSFEGKMTDRLTGPISEDGITWTANWINYAELVDLMKPDPNSFSPIQVVFEKLQSP